MERDGQRQPEWPPLQPIPLAGELPAAPAVALAGASGAKGAKRPAGCTCCWRPDVRAQKLTPAVRANALTSLDLLARSPTLAWSARNWSESQLSEAAGRAKFNFHNRRPLLALKCHMSPAVVIFGAAATASSDCALSPAGRQAAASSLQRQPAGARLPDRKLAPLAAPAAPARLQLVGESGRRARRTVGVNKG